MSKIKYRGHRPLLSMLLMVSLLLVTAAPALAEQATAADKLVQSDSTGNVTNHTAITGVNLPVVFDNNPDYYPISVDAGIFSGGASVKELTGLTSSNLHISLGAVTNYESGTVYEIKYRAHYGIIGGGSEIVGDWQSAGLYFKVEATSDVTNIAFTAATADGAADTTTSTKIDITFDTAIIGLTADDITITSGTGSATKGALTGSSTSWSIAIAGVSEGTVNVAVGSPTGYSVSGSPKTVNVYAAPTPPPPVTLQSIAITTPATKLIYTVGDALDITGLVVTGIYSNSSRQAVPITKADVTGFNSSTANSSQTLTITYDGQTTTYTVAIQAATTGRLTFSPPSGSSITAATPITITASPALSVTEAVYWNTSGSLPTTNDFLYPAGGFNLSTPETVYTAVYDASTGWSDQASATYTAAVPATGVTLDNTTMSLTAGGATGTLTATVAPDNATNQNVTWTSSDPNIATVANGIVTPLTAGTAKITATTIDGSYTADCTVTVGVSAIPITGITVTGAENATTVANGSTLQMSAAVLPADVTDPSVTWSVAAGTGSAAINSSTGLLTAAGEGTVTVIATANDGSGVSGTEIITVTEAATNQDQSAPAGLAGVAPTTSTNNDGQITGTTTAMEYKPASAADSAYITCTDTATTGLIAGIYNVRYAAKSGYNAGATTAVTVPVYVAVVAVTTASPNVNVNTTPLQITIPADVTDAALTLTSTPAMSGGNTTYTLPQVTTTAATSQGAVTLSISDGTIVTGLSSTFTGTINLPQVVSNPTVTVSGYTTAVSQAIELGSGNTALTFSQPVRILLAGQGGKLAGWIRNSSFTPIIYQMASDSAAALGTNADGYITVNNGNDLAIWTTHLTTFVAYTQAAISSNSGSGGGSAVLTPTVQTESTSAITADSALLNGNIISDNGYAVTGYGFLWDTSSSSLSNKVAVGTNDLTGTFTTTLSNLSAGTMYYYKTYATNKYGTAYGSIKSFTTSGAATVATPIITPVPTTIPTAATFSDVSASYWGYNAISSLVSKGIVSGYADGSFKPDTSITRAEFATMLVKALDLSASGITGKFTDVTANAWYYGTVNAAASGGLVSGMENNRFAPNALVTREQMAVMVSKALGDKTPTPDGTELNAFKDESAISSWAVTGIREAVRSGIVSGMTTDKLAPKASATRAQAVEMVYKLLTVLSR